MAQQIKNLLSSLFKSNNWKLKLLTDWNSITGNLSDKMRIEKIEDRTLIIGVYQSSWMQELYLLSNVLKQTINQHLGNHYITMLKFKTAEKKKPENTLQKKAVPKKIIVDPIVLSKKEHTALQKLKDPELQKALHYFLTRCHYQKVHK